MDTTTRDYTVNVRKYRRVREGVEEDVRRHKRRPRRWYRRPKTP
jgi:hypothetical protein